MYLFLSRGPEVPKPNVTFAQEFDNSIDAIKDEPKVQNTATYKITNELALDEASNSQNTEMW